MRFSGKLYKDGKFWLAEIPILDLMTQGKTKEEAYEMVADMLETMVNKEGFKVRVYKGKNNSFEIGFSEAKYMIGFLLQRKREMSGLSVSQLTESLGMSSHDSYSIYEQGKSVPSLEKLNAFFHAVSHGSDIVISESTIS